ncbi:unnamed protein product [Penicillium glandicola]
MDTSMTNLPAETISMFAIAAWNSCEVVIGVFERFKNYRGLYFWSMQIAAWGILVHCISAQIRYLSKASAISLSAPFIAGWMCMVTGQAVVLYSRLHLVVADIRHVRWVLWMIISNVFILHIPMAVLYCLNLGPSPSSRVAAIYDRFQTTGFAAQDIIICGIYVREALRALKPVFEAKGRQGRNIIRRLLVLNLLCIMLDILIVFIEYKAHYLAISFKTVGYSIKLKFEFYAFTQLYELTRTYPCAMCQEVNGVPRCSTDINIFDMLATNSSPPDSEAQASSGLTRTESPAPLHSARSSTYRFQEGLRHTVSTVEYIESQAGTRPRIHSSDTRSTVEMTLLESPK